MQPLAPAVKITWRIKSGIFWIILLGVALTVDLAVLFRSGGSGTPGLLSAAVIAVGTTFVALIPSLRYRFWRYELQTEELILVRGIWKRVHTLVPLRRIQHLDVSQDLIERNFGLARLVVHTAGTQGSSVTLPGLQHEEAERLRNDVKLFINEYAV